MDTPTTPTIQVDHRGDPVCPVCGHTDQMVPGDAMCIGCQDDDAQPPPRTGTVCDGCGERAEMVANVSAVPGGPRTMVLCPACHDTHPD